MTLICSGLEVRVGFGGVWKESLTELSGGQRSLLALSLILAMLLFKPAPIYILDEARLYLLLLPPTTTISPYYMHAVATCTAVLCGLACFPVALTYFIVSCMLR